MVPRPCPRFVCGHSLLVYGTMDHASSKCGGENPRQCCEASPDSSLTSTLNATLTSTHVASFVIARGADQTHAVAYRPRDLVQS